MTGLSLIRPPAELVPVGLRAMKTIAAAGGGLKAGGASMIAAAQRLFLDTDLDLDALDTISPEEFARDFRAPAEIRQQFVRGMAVIALADGAPVDDVMKKVSDFASAVGVEEPALRPLTLFARGHVLLGTLDYHRRSNIRGMLEVELEKGVFAAVKAILGIRGLVEDPLVAAPYLGLEDLPAGTLGRSLFEHYRANGFSFPGEKGGFPEGGVYHDLTHVLSGYGTDPRGELRVGAFTAGYRSKDPFFVALLPLLLFVAEINVTPIPHDRVDALLAQPGEADAYLRALERGSKVTLDLSDHWDFWPWMRLPLDEARRRLGIEPASA